MRNVHFGTDGFEIEIRKKFFECLDNNRINLDD